MKIINSITAGLVRSAKAWKGIVIIWFVTLLTVSLVVLPMKGALKAGLGQSMITEKLAHGIDIEVFADLGAGLSGLNAYLLSGLFMIVIISFITNSFLSGGLFSSLKELAGAFSSRKFFMKSAKYFWPFLLISLILDLLILLFAFLIIVIPVSIVATMEPSSEGALFKTFIIAAAVFFLVLIWLLAVADYARAWQVTQKRSACFKALGFGFRQTFRTILSSYLLMFILILVQLLYGLLVVGVLSGLTPVTGVGIILLFILSQIFFIVKVLLKTWRYGSMTIMIEMSSVTGF
jgi:hypothetical protein